MKLQWLVWVGLFFVAGCSNQIAGIYDESEVYGKHDKDVVENHGKVTNTQYLDDFIKNVQEHEDDEVRVVHYTTEGDLIFTYLSYDGEEIDYELDTSNDRYSAGEKVEKTCEGINRKDRSEETVYQLTCGKGEKPVDVLTISHDSNTQDQFELKFSYNKGNQVTVDTVDHSLSVQSESNSMKKKDFYFTKEERNKIYKLLVKENYMQGKDLAGSCRAKPEYSLKVIVNGSEKKFEWSSCDSGDDVEKMTEMVKEMIDIVEKTDSYRKVFS
ncbi:DUF4362 domain-containing protein [Halobacillus sp. B23F22_1]|uniref:DUF4362 domain-containing protein n=1 Tax=Halobacillus sp. B23F22_1 TaxID=3459514 RepID=UPI00373E1CF6